MSSTTSDIPSFSSHLILSYSDHEKTKIQFIKSDQQEQVNTQEGNEIRPFLYLGPHYSAELDVQFLREEKGITHILNVTNEIKTKHVLTLKCRKIAIDDSPNENLTAHIPDAIEFLKQCLVEKGCVLVHCQAGISRSSSMVISFILDHFRTPLKETISYVKERRSVISPNYGFIHHLIAFEKKTLNVEESSIDLVEYYAEWIRDFFPTITDLNVIRNALKKSNGDFNGALDYLLSGNY